MDSPELFAFKKGIRSPQTQEMARNLLPDVYQRILLILDTFIDTPKENKELLAVWIIGTYFHKQFSSFPRLFVNAMKGSGKSRLLQLLKALCWNASVQANMSEAVLFRNASKQTLLFDESESITNKEKSAMRELLNAGYKKGVDVKRMRKSITKDGEQQIVETFDLYGPVALANISGMEDVLGDRCISIILEKSKDPSKILLLEDFDKNIIIRDIKYALTLIQCSWCSVDDARNMNKGAIDIGKYNLYTLNTLSYTSTLTTLTTLYHLKPLLLEEEQDFRLTEKEIDFYQKLHEIKIDGRNLEIFFPLLNLASMISEDVFEQIKEIAKNYVEERSKQDQLENTDWSFTDFIARQQSDLRYIPVSEIIFKFKEFYAADDVEWLNSRWIGQALRRLRLSVNKRRMGKGVEYILNVAKAQDKLKLFKMVEEKKDGSPN